MADEMKNEQEKQTKKAPTKVAKTTKSPGKKTETKPKKKEGLMYQGHPLRRAENLIYYGSMADKYIVMMQVLDSEPLNDISVAKRVSVQLQLTDAGAKSRDRVVRSTEKHSLAEAMEFACIWLDRALSGKI